MQIVFEAGEAGRHCSGVKAGGQAGGAAGKCAAADCKNTPDSPAHHR